MTNLIKIHPIPLALFLFVTCYTLLDFTFIYIARDAYNGVVTENAYQKGVVFNQTLQANKRQEQLGWQSEVQIEHFLYTTKITFKLKDKADIAIINADVKAILQRPTHDREDSHLTMRDEQHIGIYQVVIPKLAYGQWELRIKAEVDHEEYYHRERLQFLPETEPKNLE